MKKGISVLILIGIQSCGNWWSGTVLAQPISDSTLANEQSIVSLNMDTLESLITGGALRGNNLFHSFESFDIQTNHSVYFRHQNQVANILARVTGNSRSDILGTLGTRGDSSPNLFLINPNGIVFGDDARLDVRGSFVATSAAAVGFGEQGWFSAVDPSSNVPLLTVDPSAFLFNSASGGLIDIQTAPTLTTNGLNVPDGNHLLVLGGNIRVDGGVVSGRRGRIELGAVESGITSLETNGDRLQFNIPDTVTLADIEILGPAQVIVEAGGRLKLTGTTISLTGVGAEVVVEESGRLQLVGQRVELLDGAVASARGGQLSIQASESVVVSGLETAPNQISGVLAATLGSNQPGQLDIQTRQLTVNNGAQIQTSTRNDGRGGHLTIHASESIALAGQQTGLFSETEGNGRGGAITLTTEQLTLEDGAVVSASTSGAGAAGRLTIDATERVYLVGSQTGLFSQAEQPASGRAGRVVMTTDQLLVQDGASISASTLGTGQAGRLSIAAHSIELSGTTSGRQGIESGLFVTADGENAPTSRDDRPSGAGGILRIDTHQLTVRDGAIITVSSFDNSLNKPGRLVIYEGNHP